MTPLEAAVAAAAQLGLPVDDPAVVEGAANVFVHLRPSPVLARVTLTLQRGIEALEGEFAFARAAGDTVVSPADDRVHEHGGLHVTFWRYVEHRQSEPEDAPAIGRALRRLHEAVRGADLALVPFDRLDEAEAVAKALDHPDRQLMLDAIAAARDRLSTLELDEQPLHGDAHMRNAFITGDGPLWSDLENVCRGPVEYDLACLALRERVHGWNGGRDAVAAYGTHDARLVEELMPVAVAFLVPWNAKIVERLGGDHPFLQERIDYLTTFT